MKDATTHGAEMYERGVAEGVRKTLESEDERIRVTCLALVKEGLYTEDRTTFGDGYNNGVIAAMQALRAAYVAAAAPSAGPPAPTLGADCTCYRDCGKDSRSGEWHQHGGDPCPEHPDAPMVD